jgi:hypothetical protein
MRHIIPQKHTNENLLKHGDEWWAPSKHGYQKLPAFTLGLPIMKVKTWLCPWTSDEFFVNVFQNMIVVEEFCNLPTKHKLTYLYHNMVFWNR